MTAIGAVILVVLLWVVSCATRRQALLGMVCGVLYLSQSQQVAILGVNFYAMRFLEVAAFVRVMVRHEFSFSSLNRIDRAFLWLYGYTTLVFLLRSDEAYASVIGNSIDAFLCYFSFRALVGNLDEWRWLLRSLVVILVPYLLVLLLERRLGYVPFSFMAGMGDFVREGVPRCMGSFQNMDLLGSFGASFLPLYIGMCAANLDRSWSVAGIVFCLAIVLLSNSGGPLGSAAAACAGWGLWILRSRMRLFRWGILAGLALLAIVMKAPIWYILDRVSSITGGSGWHRSYLIDVAIGHLGQWWAAGIPIANTHEWFPYIIGVTGGADITNQFLVFGITAGIGAMALLILLLTRAFSLLGQASAVVRSLGPRFKAAEFMLWGLGVMLTVHIVNWFGISYYDQFYVIWFLHLACIATVCSQVLELRLTTNVALIQSQRSDTGPNALTPGFSAAL